MAELKDQQVIVGSDGAVYKITNCDACRHCYFYNSINCHKTLIKLFGYKYHVNDCRQLIGSNTYTRLGFKRIGYGGV